MQIGFGFVECGSVRKKNANSILMKNLLDVCVGCLGWLLLGFGFGFGNVQKYGYFIGFEKHCFFGYFYYEDLRIFN